MRQLTCALLLGMALTGCESGSKGPPGSDASPSVDTGSFMLTASDKELVAAADGHSTSELLVAIGSIVGGKRGQVNKNKLTAALDQGFEVRCHELCEIKER